MNSVKIRNLVIGEGIPKICVPIVEKTSEEIIRAAQEIKHTTADLVEWRVDWFESAMDVETVKKVVGELRIVLRDMPVLFTFRTKKEGGEKEITFQRYSDLLCSVADTNDVDLIDVELFMHPDVSKLVATLKAKNVTVVGSNHDFVKTPPKDEVVRRLCYMQEVGVDIPKIAVMPKNPKDVLTLLDATQEMVLKYADRPIITMSMAGMGTISRIAGEVFGSAITFGSVNKASAPGQVNVEELRMIMETLH